MAWFRRMGADEVAYHQETVVGRSDDHPGQALDYYGSRGETPLRWGGAGAARLGLQGEVTAKAYEAAFGPGGFQDPVLGERLVATQRPGFELVVSAHKSVAVLGVIGDVDAMHSILDTETTATMAWLDTWFQTQGGRRGRAQVRTATSGLVYATTRHATSRAGDPSPHDHVLVANVVEMLDGKGGYKGLDSAALRDTVEAATMVGRLHSAARAAELGLQIETDPGPSGNLRHWRITGIPVEVCELFSKRADDIAAYLAEHGHSSYRARSIAARETRTIKRHTGADELLPGWQAELAAAGWPIERLVDHLTQSVDRTAGLKAALTDADIDTLTSNVLAADGEFMARHKVFTRTRLIAHVAPLLYGHDPAHLDVVVDRILAGQAVVPLLGRPGVHEQAYAAAHVLAAELAIADTIEHLTDRAGPTVDLETVQAAVDAKEAAMGASMTPGQRDAVEHVCGSGRAVDVVVGVAGSGKTTALDAASTAFEAAGYRVLGTSTSGQAARTLGHEAGVESRTLTSLLWRLDHHQLTLDRRTVVVLDEAAMTADADLLRLVVGTQRARAKLVLVGDHRQLSAIGPGGAMASVLERHPHIVATLDDNVRQHDPHERAALSNLRSGSVSSGIDWYAKNGRTAIAPTRREALVGMVAAWADDIAAGHDTALLAWRKQDVADLNTLARDRRAQQGRLRGSELEAPGGRRYAAGDRIVLLAPNQTAQLVTSQQLTVLNVNVAGHQLVAQTDDGRRIVLGSEAIGAEQLDHAYALTVHRAQGATYDRAHLLGAGGGRELAYVAMSRARQRTTLHAVADTLDQAIEDLKTDWTTEHHQRWITDTTDHGHQSGNERARPDPAARREQLVRERDAVEALIPPDVTHDLWAAERHLDRLRQDLRDLDNGTGRWRNTEVGQAARTVKHAEAQRQWAEAATRPGSPLRGRRQERRAARHWEAEGTRAREQFERLAGPVRHQIETDLAAAEHRIGELRAKGDYRTRWLIEHPEHAHRLATIDLELRVGKVVCALDQQHRDPPTAEIGLDL